MVSRIIGPNGLGVLVPPAKLNASFAARNAKSGDLALISQSGAVAAGLIEWSARRSIGFSGIVSLGDAIDVDFGDLLDHFALDIRTRAILLYVEAITDAAKFLSAARAAARVKPVIVLKAGRREQGAKAAATHTGALAGRDAVYDAAFRRAGLLRVMDLDELFAAAEALARVKSFPGKRLAILTNGGGVGVLAVDRLVELGGSASELSAATLEKLNASLPPGWSKANPVDIIGDADGERYARALEILLADNENDAVLVLNVPTALASAPQAARSVVDVVVRERTRTGKPVFAGWIGEDPAAGQAFESAAIPHYPTEADAVQGFMHLVRYREARDALMETPESPAEGFDWDSERARDIVESAVAGQAQLARSSRDRRTLARLPHPLGAGHFRSRSGGSLPHRATASPELTGAGRQDPVAGHHSQIGRARRAPRACERGSGPQVRQQRYCLREGGETRSKDHRRYHPSDDRPAAMPASSSPVSPMIRRSGRSSCSGAAGPPSRSSTTRRWRCRRST